MNSLRLRPWISAAPFTTARASGLMRALRAVRLDCRGMQVPPSHPELLAQYPFVQIMPRVEQHAHSDFMFHADVDRMHEAHFVVVSDGGDRALVGVEHLDADNGGVRQ